MMGWWDGEVLRMAWIRTQLMLCGSKSWSVGVGIQGFPPRLWPTLIAFAS